jgi:hypothetical protein
MSKTAGGKYTFRTFQEMVNAATSDKLALYCQQVGRV